MAKEDAIGQAIGKKWSLWRSANIGLGLSTLTLLLQIGNGRGFELASYADTRSAETISFLGGQILAAPLLFILIAFGRNIIHRRQPPSNKSAVWGAITFAALLAGIFTALFIYGVFFFSRTEAISGEFRKVFIADFQLGCVQKQASISQAVTEDQVRTYCACVSERMADATTYKQAGTELDANALGELRQKTEAIGYACRQ